MKRHVKPLLLFLIILMFLLGACKPAQEASIKPTQINISTPTPGAVTVVIPPYVPNQIKEIINDHKSVALASSSDSSAFRLDVSSQDTAFQWVYVLAAPFSYIGDGVTGTDLRAIWEGNSPAALSIEGLYVDGSSKGVFEKIWGPASVSTVTVVSSKELLTKTWESENYFALIPFEQLEPAWTVIPVDGQSPIQKHFNASDYLLTVPFSFLGNSSQRDLVFSILENKNGNSSNFPISNREGGKLTTVVVTGVTALVRGTAYMMETYGLTYPAIDIGDILRDADILHISNEIPFTETCPDPFFNKANDTNLVFCSKPDYIQLLEAIGTDVVELTGDHFRDWGSEAILGTLDMYDHRGWQYYGGGRNLIDGIQPALFNHNGNKIAFFGCNAKPPGYATASATDPGAVHCDMDQMAEQVENAIKQGYLPIFTFQHLEYYSYSISPALQADFRAISDAGAVIVSGSQAHQPHAFEFYKNSFLHYGLGNLFFDQYDEGFDQRQAFLDRHVFYDGKYISTELIPIMFIDMARPRLMTEPERKNLLKKVFTASGW